MPAHDASLKSYLQEISRYPLLTAEQEICYGRQVVKMYETLECKEPYTPEQLRIIRVGQKAKQKFMRSNLKLVVSIAKRYSNTQRKSLDLMDLVQEGNIGLARAVELFDPSRGYRFTTYAYWWIRQSIYRAIAQTDALVRIPVSLHDKVTRAGRISHEMQQELGRAPTAGELAERLELDMESFVIGMQRNTRHVSLDAPPVGVEDGAALMDLIMDPKYEDAYESVDRAAMAAEVVNIIETKLDALTQCILINRFSDHPTSWKDLHKQYKLPINRLQSIERIGLQTLRVELTKIKPKSAQPKPLPKRLRGLPKRPSRLDLWGST